MAKEAFYTYVLQCRDASFYVGATNNLEKRLYAHNNLKNGAHYTKIRRPVTLRYFELCKTLGIARAREAEIKRMSRQDKMRLVGIL